MSKTFTITEIINYLKSHKDINTAIEELNEQTIDECNPIDLNTQANFLKTRENLKKYEEAIGLTKQKEHQRELYRTSGGKKGRYWMALSPRWIKESKIDTQYLIFYWVNYGDRETCGWFTVEQILHWFGNPKISLSEIGGCQ